MKLLAICTVLTLFLLAASFAFGQDDQFGKFLKDNGFSPITPPRAEFGTGTVIPVKPAKSRSQLYVASQDECFPGLLSSAHTNSIVLGDSKQSKGLNLDLSGKYLPIPAVTIAGAFKRNTLKSIDVEFGPTTANNLTEEGLARYLEGKKISQRCLHYLQNDKNAIVLAAALVKKMTYKFTWDSGNNVSANVDALKKINADFGLKMTSNGTNTVVLDQPMYVGYAAFRFKDLGLNAPEAANAPILLEHGKFSLSREDFDLYKVP